MRMVWSQIVERLGEPACRAEARRTLPVFALVFGSIGNSRRNRAATLERPSGEW
jgi:hypothetical protein